MGKSQNQSLEEIKLFVVSLINSEQGAHSKLINDLQSAAGKTKECEDLIKILTEIYEAKFALLDKILRKIQSA